MFALVTGCDKRGDCSDAGGAWDEELDQCICTYPEVETFNALTREDRVDQCVARYEQLKQESHRSE